MAITSPEITVTAIARTYKLRAHENAESIHGVDDEPLTSTGEILAAIDCTLEGSFDVTIASYAVSFDYDA